MLVDELLGVRGLKRRERCPRHFFVLYGQFYKVLNCPVFCFSHCCFSACFSLLSWNGKCCYSIAQFWGFITRCCSDAYLSPWWSRGSDVSMMRDNFPCFPQLLASTLSASCKCSCSCSGRLNVLTSTWEKILASYKFQVKAGALFELLL